MRIQAARVTAEHPRLLEDLEAERLNLSSLCLLAPHVNPGNIDELVVAATHRTNAEIRQWLAARFAPPKGPTAPAARQLQVRLPQPAARQVRVEPPVPPVIPVPPSGPEPGPPLAYQMQFTMTGEDHKRFRYAQALLSHAIPSGEVAAIYRRAIEAVIAECEKRKVASTSRPRPENKRPVGGSRHVPAQVRRAVWARDGARCTFVAPSGQRCCARRFLEFDHARPVARGGASTEQNLRLRCRAHNQEAARGVFGAKLMNERRRAAATAAAERRARTPWHAPVPSPRGP